MPRFDQVELQTERLLLRPLRPADAPDLFAIFSDTEIMRYWSWPAWTDPASALEMIDHDLEGLPAGRHLRLGLERRGTPGLIGQCSLFSFMAQCRRAEIGYSLARAHWGRGYMHEALTALLDYGFGELDLNRVEADVDPRNAASIRSLERLGFRCEGLLRERWIVGGAVADTAFYGLLRHEWAPRGA